MGVKDTRYIVYDTESVVDGALLARAHYAGEQLTPEEAVERMRTEQLDATGQRSDFIPQFIAPRLDLRQLALRRLARGDRACKIRCQFLAALIEFRAQLLILLEFGLGLLDDTRLCPQQFLKLLELRIERVLFLG